MPSGAKELVVNTLERAVSTDINRMQRFADAAIAERLRAAANTFGGSDDVALFDTPNTTLGSGGEVYGPGLMVRPVATTLNLTVDAGVAMIVSPDGDSDSSVYKLAVDPGVLTGLSIGTNSSGLIRIDVIECQWTINANAETDNRDIFNPATGGFAATSVSKATQGFLTYRVRAGTAGSGFPGLVAGWMPLAVASVPSGAANVGACTFWDVRPLVSDRLFPPHNLQRLAPRTLKNGIYIDTLTSGGKALFSGLVETSATDLTLGSAGWSLNRLGGLFAGPDLNAAANQSGSLSNGPCYVYILEPFGLPRWALYSGNTPTTKGIVVVSSTAPVSAAVPSPSAPLALPTATGLGGSTSRAVCVACSLAASSTVASLQSNGKTQWPNASPTTGVFGTKTFTLSGAIYQAQFVPGTDYPANASAINIRIGMEYTIVANSAGFLGYDILTSDPTFATVIAHVGRIAKTVYNAQGTTQSYEDAVTVKVPVPQNALTFGILLNTNASSGLTFPGNLALTGSIVESWDVL